jgi:hypothetical protein
MAPGRTRCRLRPADGAVRFTCRQTTRAAVRHSPCCWLPTFGAAASEEAHWAVKRMFTIWWSLEEQRRLRPIGPPSPGFSSSSSSSSSTGISTAPSSTSSTATGLQVVAALAAVALLAVAVAALCARSIRRVEGDQSSPIRLTNSGGSGETASREERKGQEDEEQKVGSERAEPEYSRLKLGREKEEGGESTRTAAVRWSRGFARSWWNPGGTRTVGTEQLSASLLTGRPPLAGQRPHLHAPLPRGAEAGSSWQQSVRLLPLPRPVLHLLGCDPKIPHSSDGQMSIC